MKIILFFTIFACGFAQEKSLHDSKNNSLLAADVKKLPSAEENHVPNPEDDDHNCANVKEILGELSAERANNRDLNQTISDILERMEEMEKNIMRNEEKIIDNQSSVFLLSRDVEDLQEDVEENSALITNVIDDVVSLTSSNQQQTMQIESLGARSHWCGYQNLWTSVGTITYNNIFFSDSNMNITADPLDINTGIFTVPVSGAWRLSFSMWSLVGSGDFNYCYLFINGEALIDHNTYSQSGAVSSTSGRVVTLEASAGDNIEIRTTEMTGTYWDILYCAEFIPKM